MGKPILTDILFTTYNAEVGQTDDTPCIAGGTGYNVCEMAKNGKRPIAFSQDLLKWAGGSTFKKGDIVTLESIDYPDDWRCNGEFIVADALSYCFQKGRVDGVCRSHIIRNRGDIFMLDRKDNTSCRANVYLK